MNTPLPARAAWWRPAGGLALAGLLALPAWAARLVAVEPAPAGSADVLLLEFDEAPAQAPQAFALESPPRLVIDLPGVSSALPARSLELDGGRVRAVEVVAAEGRTRLVLRLRGPALPRLRRDGLRLGVGLAASEAAGAAPVPAAPAAPPPAGPASRELPEPPDFRRGPDGSGRLVLTLPAGAPAVDLRQQGQALLLDLPGVTLAEPRRRRLDVSDFGSPVQAIVPQQLEDRLRLRVEPTGAWEHSAYQTDRQFVLEVRPVRVDPNKPTPGAGYTGDRLSLNFQNIEVRALLQVIADFTQLNIVASDSVSGAVTLRLQNVPWDQALDIVLQARNLGLRKLGNVLSIAPREELAARERAELEARRQLQDLEPMRTQSFQLNYSKAQDLVPLLNGGRRPGAAAAAPAPTGAAVAVDPATGTATVPGRILSARGHVSFEARTNQLFVTDLPAKLEEVAQIIAKVDIPVRQVMIEARIVEANDTFGRSLGVRLGAVDRSLANGRQPGWGLGGDNRVAIGSNYLGVANSVSGPTTVAGAAANSYFVNLPSAALTGAAGISPATFALTLFSESANRFLNLEISALEAEGKGKIVSSPRVITADQGKATIKQGTQIPYQSAAPGAAGGTQVAFKDAVLKLEVTPQITPEGGILMDVDVSKDSRGADTISGPAIDTKQVKTQVLVENGGTVVIGGIFEQQDSTTENKVPLLGDLPGLGNLFKNRSRESRRTELLVFLTPKVVSERGLLPR